ncbi:MAG: MFS transporter [Dehalococcoidia bacterium]
MAMPGGGGQNPLAVLGNEQYRLLFIGNALSMLAFGMMQVVQGVVAFDLTGRNSAVGFVFLGQGISMLILSPIGGTLSDRISKKRLLTASQFIIGALFGGIAVLIATGWITIIFLAGATLVLGCMYSIMGPTRQAWTGDLLEGPDLAKGVALQQLMMNATRIVGPLLAGALIAAEPIGTAGTYLTMAVLFGGVVIFLAMMEPTPPRPRAHRTSVRTDITEGFRYIARSPDVRLLALVFVAVVLSGFSYQTIMPGYIENALGRPASQLGLLFGAAAIGGIVVTLGLASRRMHNPGAVMLVFGGALAVSLMLLALAPGFAAALVVAVLVGASSSGFQMLNNVNLMERTDRAYFGRVMAVTMMAFGANSIVAYPVGLLADQIGERLTLAGLACVCLAAVTAGAIALRAVPTKTTPVAVPSETSVPSR